MTVLQKKPFRVGRRPAKPSAPAVAREAQYLRDLEVLQRCEDEIVEQGGSPADVEFFGCMGRLQRQRAEGGKS